MTSREPDACDSAAAPVPAAPTSPEAGDPPMLLAVDVGMRCGLAWFTANGRLCAWRSRHFSGRAGLRAGIDGVLREAPPSVLALEGGGAIARDWERAAARQRIMVHQVYAEDWRAQMLYAREQRHGAIAKRQAEILALDVIAWSNAPAPKGPIGDDVAEAILFGLWVARHLGWLTTLPPTLAARWPV